MTTVDFDFTLLEGDLFGAWTDQGQFVCGPCLQKHHIDDIAEGLTHEQVKGSGVFFYCGLCTSRIRAPRH